METPEGQQATIEAKARPGGGQAGHLPYGSMCCSYLLLSGYGSMGFSNQVTAVRCKIRQVEESALAVDGLLKQLARDREAIFKAGILQVEGMPSFLP